MAEDRSVSDKPAGPMVPGGPTEPEEPQGFGKLVLQFFVIPMLIVAFCVAIVFLFRWLTFEQRSVEEYLVMLQQGPGPRKGQAAHNLFENLVTYIPEAKRWQGIFDMTQQLKADREKFLREHPGFAEKVLRIFEEAGDAKTRRYLAMTLGALGDTRATPGLLKALDDNDAETVIAVLLALGNLQDREALAAIMSKVDEDDAGIRQAAVYVLGAFEGEESRRVLAAALNDPDELVGWNAAFGLARQGSNAGEKVLTRLLDFEYVQKRGALTVSQRHQYRVAAIQQLAALKATNAMAVIEGLTKNDPDMPVRQAAIEALKGMRGSSG